MKRPILVTEPVETRYADLFERAAPGVPRIVLGSTALPEGLEEVEAVYFSEDLYPDGMGPFLRALKEVRSLGWLHSFKKVSWTTSCANSVRPTMRSAYKVSGRSYRVDRWHSSSQRNAMYQCAKSPVSRS